MTIAQLQSAMAAGSLSARDLTAAYLQRIEDLDRHGPCLNAVIELNPDALAAAEQFDAERRSGRVRGPLHGVPLLLKDNIDTAGRMMTTAGSLALEGSIARQDATVTRRLRAAGAVVLGKANLSEWANFRSIHSTSGWSSRGGQTRNPYALDRNPSGSSSGSAVAVAADLCAAAVGTETSGSIISPAQCCGIVGLKPTVGLVSRAGIIPIAHSQDTAGPLARTVADAALLLGALAGVDPADPATEESRGRSFTDYARFLDAGALRGARIGVARNLTGYHEGADRALEAALEAMRRAGAVIVDPANVDTADRYRDSEVEVLLREFKADLNRYLAALGPEVTVHSLEQLIEFNERNCERVMPYFGQDILITAQGAGPLTDERYLKALADNHRLARTEGIDATLAAHRLDAIVASTGGPACLTDWVNGDHSGGCSASLAAVAGYPSITVPAGYVFGLPVGISFIAGAYQEPTLIRIAYAFEQATQVRCPPRFLPTVELG